MNALELMEYYRDHYYFPIEDEEACQIIIDELNKNKKEENHVTN